MSAEKPSVENKDSLPNSSSENTGEATLAILKSQAVNVDGVYFKGIANRERRDGRLVNGLSEVKYNPLTWNENSGIIMFADSEGKQFATPSNDRVREILFKDKAFKRAEGMGVLNLSDVEGTWGDKENAENNSTFRGWRELALQNRAVQERESAAMRAEQEAATAASISELNDKEEAARLATEMQTKYGGASKQ